MSNQLVSNPILILDKHGIVGGLIANYLAAKNLIVFISNKPIKNKNIVNIPYGPNIPRIPNNVFSHLIVVDINQRDVEHFLPALTAKAEQSQGQILFVNNVYSLTHQLSKGLSVLQLKYKIILYGDIFSQEVVLSEKLQLMVRQLKKNRIINLPNSGLNLFYLSYLPDLLKTIYALMYNDAVGVYCLFPKQGVSQISLARLFHQRDTEIQLNLSTLGVEKDTIIPKDSIELFSSSDAINQLEKINPDKLEYSETALIKSRSSKNRSPIAQKCLNIILGTLMCLILIPLVFSLLGISSLVSSLYQTKSGHIVVAAQLAKIAKNSFTLTNETLLPVDLFEQMIGLKYLVNAQINSLVFAGEVSNIILNLNEGIDLLKPIDSAWQADQGLGDLHYAVQQLEELKAFNQLSFLSGNEQDSINQLVDSYSYLTDSTKTLVGENSPQTYLVLFQNSNELRPGGGFIGSYGLLTINKGSLESFSLNDIYALDGQLQGHVEPPDVLKQYLGIQHWFMRDSNFSADPEQNSVVENYFYDIESGKRVDGIITIDTFFMQSLLGITGPIKVSDYNQTVDRNNFFQITEDHAEKNFTPGSQQKKDFLSSFATALKQRLLTHPLSPIQLQQLIGGAIIEKHLIISSTNPFINIALRNALLSLSAADRNDSLPNNYNTLYDFFALNEANLGVNKVNRYLQRSMQHEVSIDSKGIVSHTVLVSYNNTSTPKSSYGGVYKAFVRFIIPANATLNYIKINNQNQPFYLSALAQQPTYKGRSFVLPNTLQVFPESVLGENSYGFLVNVPMLSNLSVSLNYTLAQKVDPAINLMRYQLYLYKQPGTDADPVSVQFSAGPSINLKNQLFGTNVTNHSATTQFALSQDRLFSILLKQ